MGALVSAIEGSDAAPDVWRRPYSGEFLQVVLMALKPGMCSQEEPIARCDQYVSIEEGHGEITMGGTRTLVRCGDGIFVPAGTRHAVKNTGGTSLRLYALCGPPSHAGKPPMPETAKQNRAIP